MRHLREAVYKFPERSFLDLMRRVQAVLVIRQGGGKKRDEAEAGKKAVPMDGGGKEVETAFPGDARSTPDKGIHRQSTPDRQQQK